MIRVGNPAEHPGGALLSSLLPALERAQYHIGMCDLCMFGWGSAVACFGIYCKQAAGACFSLGSVDHMSSHEAEGSKDSNEPALPLAILLSPDELRKHRYPIYSTRKWYCIAFI